MGRRENTPTMPETGGIPLGTKIRALRWYRAKSLEDFARDVGDYTPSHITQIENGTRNPSRQLLARIAAELEISLEELTSTERSRVEEWIKEGDKHTRKGRHATHDWQASSPDVPELAKGLTQKLRKWLPQIEANSPEQTRPLKKYLATLAELNERLDELGFRINIVHRGRSQDLVDGPTTQVKKTISKGEEVVAGEGEARSSGGSKRPGMLHLRRVVPDNEAERNTDSPIFPS